RLVMAPTFYAEPRCLRTLSRATSELLGRGYRRIRHEWQRVAGNFGICSSCNRSPHVPPGDVGYATRSQPPGDGHAASLSQGAGSAFGSAPHRGSSVLGRSLRHPVRARAALAPSAVLAEWLRSWDHRGLGGLLHRRSAKGWVD